MNPNIALPIGKLLDLPNEEYHAAPAISHSKLEDFRSRASYYYAKHIAKRVKEAEKEDMLIGHASHTLVLEGVAAYEDRYAVEPLGAPRRPTKAQLNAKKPSEDSIRAIEFWKEWDEENKGACVITHGIDRLNRGINASVHANKVAHAILSDPQFVPEVTWRIRLQNGLYLQCRTDGWIESMSEATAAVLRASGIEAAAGQSLVADLKTCGSLTSGEFGAFDKGIINYGYHRQQAFYLPIISAVRGIAPDHFLFIAAEKSEPFETGVYALDRNAIEAGMNENENDTISLIQCFKSDYWPGVPQNAVLKASLPEWYLRKADALYVD